MEVPLTLKDQATGGCLCGAVKFSFPLTKQVFDVCHCGMCRKWSGGPGFAVQAGTDVKIDGNESVAVYKSSDWAERGFCKSCGTHLFYRLTGAGAYHFFLGAIDNSDRLKFHLQIFVDHKPANYTFANQTKQMTEAEVFAMHSQG